MSPLAVRGLAVGYGRRCLQQGLGFAVEEGACLAVLGPNGCGKTTLFRTLPGLQPALAGEVLLADRPLAAWPDAARAERIGYVPQAPASPFGYSLAEVVMMGRAMHVAWGRVPSRHDAAIAQAALQRLGIAGLATARIDEVSGGERQLAYLARALATEARVLVLDEPAAFLDFGNQGRVEHELARLKAAGYALIFSTHDPNQALALADHVLLLGHAGAPIHGPLQTCWVPERLSAIYGTAVTLATVAGRQVVLRGAPHGDPPA